MTFKKHINLIFVFCTLLVVSFAFQNCTNKFQPLEMESKATGTSSYETGIQVPTDNCLTSTSSSVCIFAKSPVAQLGRAITESEITTYQKLSVTLPSLTTSTALASADLSVQNESGNTYTGSSWKVSYSSSREIVAAISAYYYAQSFKNWLKNQFSISSLDGRGLAIKQGANVENGYYHNSKSIYISLSTDHLPLGLDGSSVVNLMSHTLIAYESSALIYTNQNTSTSSCLNLKNKFGSNNCCKSKSLCGPAITQGAADYITALYFADTGSTSIGETWLNSADGAKHCGINRSPARNTALTSTQAYSACSSYSGASGYIYPMASLYSSLWWEARLLATNKNKFDEFFIKHLSLIKGEDTWTSLSTKLNNLASGNSDYSEALTLLTAQANARGL